MNMKEVFGILSFLLILLPVEPACLRNIVLNAGNPSKVFTSPGYPERHKAKLTCTYKIFAPAGYGISLRCPIVNLQGSKSCGRVSLAYGKGKKCGRISVQETFLKRRLRVLFRSNLKTNKKSRGFRCIASLVPLPTDPPVTDPPETDPTTSVSQAVDTSTMDPMTTVSPAIDPSTPETQSCQCGIRNSERIIGGEETEVNEFPWQGRLIIVKGGYSYLCSATLISSEWLVSAAHCTEGAESIQVVLGEHYRNTVEAQSETIEVEDIIDHPNYDGSSAPDNDISLLKLIRPVTFNQYISPVCLPFNYAEMNITDEIGTVTGWGTTSSGSTSNVLMEVDVPLIGTEDCRTDSNYESSISDNMICAGISGKDSCQGDSGGPLVWENDNSYNMIVGIVSWGRGCALTGYPGVYTKVINYLTWIKEETEAKDEFCVIE
ncbi:UNVERIFIED_CONTAM: hypothetical protein GTU68_001983 [Idotea baltica]|nr:hypothetical protein [Idotea baltica]